MNDDRIPPSRQALTEALALSDVILRNIELSEVPLVNVALKASRLARLLNDFDNQRVMEYEASGYPSTPDGMPAETFNLAKGAGRSVQEKDAKTGEIKEYVYTSSLEDLEHELKFAEIALAAARDPDVSVTSANPNQYVWNPKGNVQERTSIRASVLRARERLSSRRRFLHSYAARRYHELKYSGIAGDIFSRIRESVDRHIGSKVPSSAQKLTAVYANLQSDNPEDWSNAVHSCRRILQDLADAIYPAREPITKEVGGQQKTIKLGPDNYINRLIAYVEDMASSERFEEIVGSHISFIGERLDSVFKAAQKGSHDTVSRDEADRYVVYTYLIVGDILSL